MKTDEALLATARALVREAETYKDRLVPLGLPPTFSSDLQKAADALELALRGRRTGRSGMTEARAGMAIAIDRGFEAVLLLDVVVTNALKDDPKLFAAWQRDRRVDMPVRTHPREAAPAAPAPADAASPVDPSTPEPAPSEPLVKAS